MSRNNNTGRISKLGDSRYWLQASVLDRRYCGINGGLESIIYQPADVTFQIYTGIDKVKKGC